MNGCFKRKFAMLNRCSPRLIVVEINLSRKVLYTLMWYTAMHYVSILWTYLRFSSFCSINIIRNICVSIYTIYWYSPNVIIFWRTLDSGWRHAVLLCIPKPAIWCIKFCSSFSIYYTHNTGRYSRKYLNEWKCVGLLTQYYLTMRSSY